MWSVERVRGSARAVHGREVPADQGATVWVVETDAAALVLGSTQPESDVDREACRDQGIDVVRRRSGGGAVLLVPGEVLWVDVIVPAGDPSWTDDVTHAAWWVGEVWLRVLGRLGAVGVPRVHRGALETGTFGPQVCFAGRGPGEVLVGEAKLVGISQRRTRSHARIQCAVHRRVRVDVMAAVTTGRDGPAPTADDLRPLIATWADVGLETVSDEEVVAALLAELDGS